MTADLTGEQQFELQQPTGSAARPASPSSSPVPTTSQTQDPSTASTAALAALNPGSFSSLAANFKNGSINTDQYSQQANAIITAAGITPSGGANETTMQNLTAAQNLAAQAAGLTSLNQTNPNVGGPQGAPSTTPTGLNTSPTPLGTSGQGPDANFSNAVAAVTPTSVPTEQDFYSQIFGMLSPAINAIQETEMATDQAADIQSTQNTSSMNASLGARGLAGSTEGNTMATQVEAQRQATITEAKAAADTATANLVQFAVPEAASEYQAALTRNDANSQAYIAKTQNDLKTTLVGLASSGQTLSDIKQSNPQEYNTLLQYAGGDENNLNAMFVSATTSTLLNNGQPLTTSGNSYIYGIPTIDANGNPSIKAISVSIPSDVPANYKMVTNTTTALGGVYTQYAPVGIDGTSITDPTKVMTYLNGQQIAGPGTPTGQNATTVTGGGDAVQGYVDGIKNGTITSISSVPAQYKNQVAVAMDQQNISSPLADSRYTNAVNKVVANYISLPGYQLTANGLPYLQRIAAAEETPGSISDQDLLDSLTKLNTAGNAISDAQVKLITDGQSYSDWANVISNKTKTGGVLSDAQRQQIQTIAQNIYQNYQEGYQPIYDQVTSQLKDAGIPSDYWTIPDLNTLYSGQTGMSPSGSSNNNDYANNW